MQSDSPNNLMVGNPGLFNTPESRLAFCRAYHFLPVEDKYSQPSMGDTLPAEAQLLCLADYRREVWAQYRRDGIVPSRGSANLKPTALLYESDNLTIDEQQANIRPEAWPSILSVTHSGNKSLHIVVPLPANVAEAIIARDLDDAKKVYRFIWREVAARLFIRPNRLDASCASIGHLSRLPGARRQPDGASGRIDPAWLPVQTCLFLNAQPEYLDYAPIMDAAIAEVEEEARDRAENAVLYAVEDLIDSFSDYGDDLEHLRNSNAKYPKARKGLVLRVLERGDIPSESQLKNGLTYIGTVKYLNSHFRHLARKFVEMVKAAHPSNLPMPVEYYLQRDSGKDED